MYWVDSHDLLCYKRLILREQNTPIQIFRWLLIQWRHYYEYYILSKKDILLLFSVILLSWICKYKLHGELLKAPFMSTKNMYYHCIQRKKNCLNVTVHSEATPWVSVFCVITLFTILLSCICIGQKIVKFLRHSTSQYLLFLNWKLVMIVLCGGLFVVFWMCFVFQRCLMRLSVALLLVGAVPVHTPAVHWV